MKPGIHPDYHPVVFQDHSTGGSRVDYNTIRPHEALAWNRPHDVYIGLADPRIPNFPEPEILPTA
jgi:ribosomal protein L31